MMKKECPININAENDFKKLYDLKECSVIIHKLSNAQYGSSLRSHSLSDKYENIKSDGGSCNSPLPSAKCKPKKIKTVAFETIIGDKREINNSALCRHSSDSIKTCFDDSCCSQHITKGTFRDPYDIAALSQDQISNASKQPSKIKSFYEYESFGANLSKIAPKTHKQSQKSSGVDSIARWQMLNNAPSTKEIQSSLEKAGIFETREIAKSVVYSSKEDAKASGSIDIGLQKVKVEWNRKLPEFKSQVIHNDKQYNIELPTDNRETSCHDNIVLQCTQRPPSSKIIHQNYITKTKLISDKVNILKQGKSRKTKFKIRMRLNSGSDSDASSSTLSQCSRSEIESDDGSDTKKSEEDPLSENNSTHSKPVVDILDTQNSSISMPYELGIDANKRESIPQVSSITIHNQDAKQYYPPSLESSLPLDASTLSASNISAQNLQKVKTEVTGPNTNKNYITILSMECFIKTRQKLMPDPDFDPIEAIFYFVENDQPNNENIPYNKVNQKQIITGMILVDPTSKQSNHRHNILKKLGAPYFDDTAIVETEECLLVSFVETMQLYDPDILVGYDLETFSFGFVVRRAAVKGKQYSIGGYLNQGF